MDKMQAAAGTGITRGRLPVNGLPITNLCHQWPPLPVPGCKRRLDNAPKLFTLAIL